MLLESAAHRTRPTLLEQRCTAWVDSTEVIVDTLRTIADPFGHPNAVNATRAKEQSTSKSARTSAWSQVVKQPDPWPSMAWGLPSARWDSTPSAPPQSCKWRPLSKLSPPTSLGGLGVRLSGGEVQVAKVSWNIRHDALKATERFELGWIYGWYRPVHVSEVWKDSWWTNDFLRKYDFDQAAHPSVSGNHPLPDKQIFVDQDEMGKHDKRIQKGLVSSFLIFLDYGSVFGKTAVFVGAGGALWRIENETGSNCSQAPAERRTARRFNLTYKYFRTLDSGNDTEFPRNSMSDTPFFSACWRSLFSFTNSVVVKKTSVFFSDNTCRPKSDPKHAHTTWRSHLMWKNKK